MAAQSVLVADIGGTHARFAIATHNRDQISLNDVRVLPTKDFGSLEEATRAYLESIGHKTESACFAVAAPVEQVEIQFTNSTWRFRCDQLQSALSLKQFHVVNDFYALAAGVGYLPEDAFEPIKLGKGDPSAPVLVLGPGTGLGQALIMPTPNGPRIVSTQGGHVGFAPSNDQEIEILKFLARDFPRVSVERLLSGDGLVNLHRAICAITGAPEPSLTPDEITASAAAGTSPDAVKAVDLFCEILGRTAGDAVLSTGARGGVVLGGGILPNVQDLFIKSKFVDCFLDKGRMQSYVGDVPIKLIVKGETALLGAAYIALKAHAAEAH